MEDGDNKKKIRWEPQEYRTYRNGGDPQDYDSERDGGLRRNDPYRRMGNAGEEMRPDFLKDPKGTASGEKKAEGGASEIADDEAGFYKKSERNKEAAQDLASAEEGASSSPKNIEDNVDGTRTNEEDAGGFYSGEGEGETIGTKKKLKGLAKKKGPILAIFMAIFGAGIGMFGIQSMMPIAIEELIIEKFNSIGVSSALSSDTLMNDQLNCGISNKLPDRKDTSDVYCFSEYQLNQFKMQGFKLTNVEVNSKKGAVLLYPKHNATEYVPVAGSELLGSASPTEIANASQLATGVSEVRDAVPFEKAMTDLDFKLPYMTASRTWRTGTSGWFDKIMKNLTEVKLNLTRTRWAGYAASTFSGISNKFNEIASGNKTISGTGASAGYEETIGVVDAEGKPVIGEDGKQVTETRFVEETEGGGGDGIAGATSESTLSQQLISKAKTAAMTAKVVTDVSCGIATAMVSIYSTVSAYQALQYLNLITGFMEAVDMVKGGKGEESPVAEYAVNLTTPANTTDKEGNILKGKTNKTAMMASGIAWLFDKNLSIDTNDPSVQNTNFETLMSKAWKASDKMAEISKVLEACGYAKMATSAVNLVVDAILLVTTAGVGNVIKAIGKNLLVSVSIYTLTELVIAPLITNAIKMIAKNIMKNVATEWLGEDLGNALVSGANRLMGGNATSGGQSPGSRAKVTAYLIQQDKVIADEADYQRATRSPFDVRSKYTFLGNLAYSIIPLAYSNNLISALTNLSSLTANAFTKILPTASAIDIGSSISSTGDCPLLDNANILADAYCNPYIITDVSTSGISATEIYDIVHRGIGGEVASVGHSEGIKDNMAYFKEDGSIKEGSNMAKYIVYCGQRTTQYTLYDGSIAEKIKGGAGGIGGWLLNNVPLVSNVYDIINGLKETKNVGWINGRNCIADTELNTGGGGTENQGWENEFRYIQRYTETERLLEGMNPGYTSTVTAFLEDYYKENPIDTSFEGTLARFSGQTKEQVENTLALIDYYNALDDYDPMTRVAFYEVKSEPKPINLEGEDNIEGMNVVLALRLPEIVFADLRGKYYTV